MKVIEHLIIYLRAISGYKQLFGVTQNPHIGLKSDS